MAEVSTSEPSVVTVEPGNATGTATAQIRAKQTIAIAVTLFATVFIMGAVAGMAMLWKPEEWTLVTTVVNNMQALALILAGGLLGATKPSGH